MRLSEIPNFGANDADEDLLLRECFEAAVASPQTVLGNSEGLVSRAERKDLDIAYIFYPEVDQPFTESRVEHRRSRPAPIRRPRDSVCRFRLL
jgi:hypothetical protein